MDDLYRPDQFHRKHARPFTVRHACGHPEELRLTGEFETVLERLDREAARDCPACRREQQPPPSEELARAIWE